MIVQGEITPEQREQSETNYFIFSAMNGVSYICVGETLIILFAVKMNMPDICISIVGAMLYVGYLLLPFGKIVAAKVGGAKSQSVFWICRNIAGLLVASAAPLYVLHYHVMAMVMILLGAFLFYGCRAAGCSMSLPLLREWTTNETRPRSIAWANGLFFAANIVTLLLISLVLNCIPGLSTLTGIILFGSVCGVGSAKFVSRICETEKLRESAKKPLFNQLPQLFRQKLYRRVLASTFIYNLLVILYLPTSMLALKRGFHIPDDEALSYAIAQFGGATVFSFIMPKVFRYFSPRWIIIASHCLFIFIGLTWVVLPSVFNPLCCVGLFILCGICLISWGNANTQYFVSNIMPRHQVGMSIINFVLSGGTAGLTGMALVAGLFKWANHLAPYLTGTLDGYRFYFALASSVMLPMVGIHCLLPDHRSKIWNILDNVPTHGNCGNEAKDPQ